MRRAVLCARSEYFAVMLSSGFREGQQQCCTELQPVLEFPDVDLPTFLAALRWMYTDLLDANLGADALLAARCFSSCSGLICVYEIHLSLRLIQPVSRPK